MLIEDEHRPSVLTGAPRSSIAAPQGRRAKRLATRSALAAFGRKCRAKGRKTCSKIRQTKSLPLHQLLENFMHEACAYGPVWPLWHPCEATSRAGKVCQSNKGNNVHAEGMNIALSRPGGHGGVAAPVPIPNTAVKRPSANGTSSQDAGE